MKAFGPDLSITLTKRIGRVAGSSARYSQSRNDIDLTQFFGDGCTLTTNKDIRQPRGAWSMVATAAADMRQQAALDSLYGIVEPMDYIEIRMARSPEKYGGQPQNYPVVMRGFVGEVRDTESMQGDKPARNIIITGADFGRIGNAAKIIPRLDYPVGIAYLTSGALFAETGLFGKTMLSGQFMGNCLTLLNTWLGGLNASASGFAAPGVPLIKSGILPITGDGLVTPTSTLQLFEGDVWSLMATWADSPWNELFIEDRQDGPYLVYRICPFEDLTGNLLLPGAVRADTGITLTEDDIEPLDLVRSDANAFNYYLMDAPYASLAFQDALNFYSLTSGTALDTSDPNCDPTLYGVRALTARSTQIAPDSGILTPQGDEANQQYTDSNFAWVEARRNALRAMNRDNTVLDRGTIHVTKGNENLVGGKHVTLSRGGIKSRFYIYGVSHTFTALQSFRTSLAVERGTYFFNRIKSQGSAYFKESAVSSYG